MKYIGIDGCKAGWIAWIVSDNQAPVFKVVREDNYAQRLFAYIKDAELSSATLISFTFSSQTKNPEREPSTRPDLMFDALAEAAQSADITLVIGQAVKSQSKLERDLSRLSLAGVSIKLSPKLHAKVSIFDLNGRKAWLLGSSNITYGGFKGNTELNVVGYREADYEAVAKSVDAIVKTATQF